MVLVWLLNYQNCIVIINTDVFSVSIVDVHASNPMACEIAYAWHHNHRWMDTRIFFV